MRLDDRARDRQSYPHAVAARGDERLEQPIGYVRGEAGTGVGDRDLDHAGLRHGRRHHHVAA